MSHLRQPGTLSLTSCYVVRRRRLESVQLTLLHPLRRRGCDRLKFEGWLIPWCCTCHPHPWTFSWNLAALKNCLDVVLDSAAASRYRNWFNFETESFSPCIRQPWFVTQQQEVITTQYYTPSWKSLFYQNITWNKAFSSWNSFKIFQRYLFSSESFLILNLKWYKRKRPAL